MGSRGNFVVAVFALQAIPLGILVSSTRDRSLRRPQFWVRFALFAFFVTLPELILVALSAVGLAGQVALGLLWGGFVWGVLLVQMGPLVLLFKGPDSGPSDDGPDGPDPRDGRPSPHPPIGGLPLPDADQSSMRIRGPHSRRPGANRRRPARGPKRAPSHTWSFKRTLAENRSMRCLYAHGRDPQVGVVASVDGPDPQNQGRGSDLLAAAAAQTVRV